MAVNSNSEPPRPPATSLQGLTLEWVTPWTPSCNLGYLLEKKPFRIGLRVKTTSVPCKPDDVLVSLWTNIYHKGNNEGEWHAVPATYQGICQRADEGITIYLYGLELTLTCLGVYRFTFRAKHKFDSAFLWAGKMGCDGVVNVKLPVKDYTTWIQQPVINKITKNVYLGNCNAAIQSIDEGFDCLINMADDVHIFPEQFIRPIIYKRCPLPFGADNPISSEVIEKIIRWLRVMSDNCNKIMVCSRTGHARSGSIVIAYIYFMNPDLNFEEAYAFVDKRSPVYPHKGLKKTVMALYPRS